MTTRAEWFEDSAGERLVAVVTPGAGLVAADEALAYGLAWQGDRDLLLVLPTDLVDTTSIRLPWIQTQVRVYSWDGSGETGPDPEPAPSRDMALDRMRAHKPRSGDDHALAPHQQAWTAAIDLAGFTARHRPSYQAWHLGGLQVLKVARARGGGVRVQAGVQYSRPVLGRSVFDAVITGPLTPAQLNEVHDRLADAKADGGSRTSQMREHRLQHDLEQDSGASLGLRVLMREFPAFRGPGISHPGSAGRGRAGFIDFLALDEAGRLHVVETKVGHDPCVLLQALDYAIWVQANQGDITANEPRLADARTTAPVAVDLVLAPKKREPAFSTYLAGQIEALSGDVPVRVHLIPDLDDPLTVKLLNADDRWTPQPGLVAAPATPSRWSRRITPDLFKARP